MPMPKTAVNENNDAVLGEHEIWCSREISPVKAKSQTRRMQVAADHEFWTRVFTSDPGHHSAASRPIYYVHRLFAQHSRND